MWDHRRLVFFVKLTQKLKIICSSHAVVSEIWAALAKNNFKSRYTTDWHTIIAYVSDHQQDRVESFLARYVLQASLYTVWRERNGRRHGEAPNSAARLIRWIDKQVRNQLSSIRALGDRRYDKGLQLWFESRS
ncbi:hypothetical protein V5N11_014333 [Cardamine amara subsp. amara]|uniref:Uncharacterized protein n=1 Tax=Cardamine amara subsp. amara TaxID=228776 RepID=A0ABD0ZKD1_CARAN